MKLEKDRTQKKYIERENMSFFYYLYYKIIILYKKKGRYTKNHETPIKPALVYLGCECTYFIPFCFI